MARYWQPSEYNKHNGDKTVYAVRVSTEYFDKQKFPPELYGKPSYYGPYVNKSQAKQQFNRETKKRREWDIAYDERTGRHTADRWIADNVTKSEYGITTYEIIGTDVNWEVVDNG